MKVGKVLAIGGGVAIAIVAVVALVVVPLMLLPADSPAIAHTPADKELAFENVEVHPSDQPITIRAWWIPADAPIASVLCVHGGNGNRENAEFGALDYYRALHERHINVFTIDLRNHGESDKSASGRLTFGREEQFDARAALEWLRAKTPGMRVFGSADSMGGATLLQLAAAGGQFDGLVLIDPVLNNEDAIVGASAAILALPRALTVASAWSVTHLVRIETFPKDPIDAAKDVRMPILQIQDETDPVARIEYARAFAKRNAHVELHVIGLAADDAVHVGASGWGTHVTAFLRQPKRVLELIDQFVAAH